jgi:hypothetical protein
MFKIAGSGRLAACVRRKRSTLMCGELGLARRGVRATRQLHSPTQAAFGDQPERRHTPVDDEGPECRRDDGASIGCIPCL